MFTKSEKYYDALYQSLGKDYLGEAKKVHQFIQKYKRSKGNSLLDVACGTAPHAPVLKKHYTYEGLDLDPEMLKIAHKKHPNLKFTQGDMIDFELGRRFDIVICLFSSIGYAKSKSTMNKAIKTMAGHLLPGGVLLIEPWFSPAEWNNGSIRALHVDGPDFKITRMSFTGRKGNISLLEFHYMVGTKTGVEYFVENHDMGLFSHAEYMHAFEMAGLKTVHHKKGLNGRGLYIGIKK